MPSHAFRRDSQTHQLMQQLRTFAELAGNDNELAQKWAELHRSWWRVAKTLGDDDEDEDDNLNWALWIENGWADSPSQLTTLLSRLYHSRWQAIRALRKPGSREDAAGRATSVARALNLVPSLSQTPWKLFLYWGDAASSAEHALFKRVKNWHAKSTEEGKQEFLKVLNKATLDRHGRNAATPPVVSKDDVLEAMRRELTDPFAPFASTRHPVLSHSYIRPTTLYE